MAVYVMPSALAFLGEKQGRHVHSVIGSEWGRARVVLGFSADGGSGLSYELTREKDVNAGGWQRPASERTFSY